MPTALNATSYAVSPRRDRRAPSAVPSWGAGRQWLCSSPSSAYSWRSPCFCFGAVTWRDALQPRAPSATRVGGMTYSPREQARPRSASPGPMCDGSPPPSDAVACSNDLEPLRRAPPAHADHPARLRRPRGRRGRPDRRPARVRRRVHGRSRRSPAAPPSSSSARPARQTSPGIVLLVGGRPAASSNARRRRPGARRGISGVADATPAGLSETATARWSPARSAPTPTRRTSPTRR